jgi:hypothetical protein
MRPKHLLNQDLFLGILPRQWQSKGSLPFPGLLGQAREGAFVWIFALKAFAKCLAQS